MKLWDAVFGRKPEDGVIVDIVEINASPETLDASRESLKRFMMLIKLLDDQDLHLYGKTRTATLEEIPAYVRSMGQCEAEVYVADTCVSAGEFSYDSQHRICANGLEAALFITETVNVGIPNTEHAQFENIPFARTELGQGEIKYASLVAYRGQFLGQAKEFHYYFRETGR